MNNFFQIQKIVIALFLTLFLYGCIKKNKNSKPQNNGQTTTNQLTDSNSENFKTYPGLENKDGLYYRSGENEPFTGATESNYNNGVPLVRANFKDGKLHGTYTAYYKSGKKMGVSNYSEGIKHGESIAWHENGVKASEVYFNEGAEHGILKIYYPNGQQRLEAEYENGEMVGMLKEWDQYGTLVNVHMHDVEEIEEG